jgi:hypothetical protein
VPLSAIGLAPSTRAASLPDRRRVLGVVRRIRELRISTDDFVAARANYLELLAIDKSNYVAIWGRLL